MLASISLGALYAAARVTLVPSDPQQGVAVVFAPWTSSENAIRRTVEPGARFVRFGGLSFVTVAIPDGPDYPARVLSAGAWLVVDPQVIAACLAPFGQASSS